MRYKVISTINHDNVKYDIGEEVYLSDNEAKPLLEYKVIEPFVKPFAKKVQPTALNMNNKANEHE